MAAFWRCLVGWQTVSTKRTSEFGEAMANRFGQLPHFLDRLRGLGGDAKARALRELEDVRLRKHHIKLRQVFGQTAHFDMIALADDDGVEPLPHQLATARWATCTSGQVASMHLQPALARPLQRLFRRRHAR